MKTLRIGFIGSGPRAQGLIRTCLPIKGLKITALCDKYEALVRKAAAIAGDPAIKVFTDHRTMLKEAPIDAACIVVEPENCPSLVVESLEAGKHVLSEVPMSYEMDDIWRIVVTIERTGLKYMLNEGSRYRPFFEKWKTLREEGTLGKIVYAEGQYLHGMTNDRYFMDPITGARLTIEEAKSHPNSRKSRVWNIPHPILYLPHELSPLLRVLDDRVLAVSCMGTNPTQSYAHDFFTRPDLETALMHTAKDTILRLSCGFTIFQARKKITGRHWYSMMGTKGSVETHRSDHDRMKLLIVGERCKEQPEEVWWDYDKSSAPAEALASGHEGADYWPIRYFVDAVLNDTTPELDAYKAAETASPAIVAAKSAEKDGVRMEVPDFRPGPGRQAGKYPKAT
jgi:predicted dehydrogenase